MKILVALFHVYRRALCAIVVASGIAASPSAWCTDPPAPVRFFADPPPPASSPSETSAPGALPAGSAAPAALSTGASPSANAGERSRNAANIAGRSRIVLVLQLESAAFTRAADAVRRGFLAAAAAANSADGVEVVSYNEGGLEGALAAARFAEPDWIVGPLTRDDVNALCRVAEPLPPVLALNQPDDPASIPAQVVTFSLSVEGEARQAAARLRSDGTLSVAMITGGGTLQRRVAVAFEAEWRRLGGGIAGRYPVGVSTQSRRLREDIRRSEADAVFLALDASEAQRIRPALGTTRIYATSQVYEGQDSSLLRELDGVRFFAMPWLVRPESDPSEGYVRDDTGNPSLDRLYAFGIDAWRLVSALRGTSDPSVVAIDGVTGRIAMASPRQFGRDGVLSEIRDGRLVALENE